MSLGFEACKEAELEVAKLRYSRISSSRRDIDIQGYVLKDKFRSIVSVSTGVHSRLWGSVAACRRVKCGVKDIW